MPSRSVTGADGYEEDQMEQHVLSLLVLSHSYVVPRLKRECEHQLEHKYLNVDNAIDVFQLALLCDAPRLSIICHRLILNNLKAVELSDGWKAMKESHPILEKELLSTVSDEANLDSDIRLCIRDSLFRLAESAFQRKNYGDTVSTSSKNTDESIEEGSSSKSASGVESCGGAKVS